MSRKTIYERDGWDEKLEVVEGWARDGLDDEQIAHNMGISRTTLHEYKNKYPKFADALKKGKEVVDREVENALLKRALGYEVEETKKVITKGSGDKQKIVKTTKHVKPDTTAQIFWLKNRKRDDWRNNPEVEDQDDKLEEFLEGVKDAPVAE